MFSTITSKLCTLLCGCLVITLTQLCAQTEPVDTSDYIQSLSKSASNFNLLVAASKGYDSEIDRLVELGADINTSLSDGATPLIYAVANRHETTVLKILSYNADINKMTFRYETPLMVAVKNQDQGMAELLIRNGAEIERTDGNGAAPLHFAVLNGDFGMTDMLLYYEADCNVKSADGTSPLMAAVLAGNANIADLLVQNGANMEARDEGGFSPFLIAAQNGDTLLMDLFLRNGVDLYEKTNRNFNALDLAIANDRSEAVTYLLARGNEWSSTEKGGLDPYRAAFDFDRRDIVNLLKEKKVPGQPGIRINETWITLNEKFTLRDIYSGIRISLKESVMNAGVFAGADLKLWYTRVLVKTSENVYYQYFNRNSVIYAGLFKDLTIYENPVHSKLLFSGALSAAYLFGNILKGTDYSPRAGFKLVPSASLILQIKKFAVTSGIEYMRSGFFRTGSLQGRIGVSYVFFTDRISSSGKVIKWR